MNVGAWLVKGRLARQRRRAGFALSVGTSAVASCSTLSIEAPISVASPALRSKVPMPGWQARAAQSSGPNATSRPADDATRPAVTSVQAARIGWKATSGLVEAAFFAASRAPPDGAPPGEPTLAARISSSWCGLVTGTGSVKDDEPRFSAALPDVACAVDNRGAFDAG